MEIARSGVWCKVVDCVMECRKGASGGGGGRMKYVAYGGVDSGDIDE